MSARRPVFVHVGSSKTGTSALQAGLWASVDVLRQRGIGIPFPGRVPHVQQVLRPLGWQAASGFVGPVEAGQVKRLTRVLRRCQGDRLLISNEDLAEAGADQVSAVVEACAAADLDVHVVLTARDWAKQLPSEWQQFLKHRLTDSYPTFLDDVRARRGAFAQQFWRRQDVLDICTRWGADLPPDRVHVIPVPERRVDPDAVFRNFGAVVGFDPSVLTLPDHDVNASYGYVEAEVLRRVNLALGNRLPDYEADYVPTIRRVLVKRILARQASARIPLPVEHLDWVRQLGREQVDKLLASGHAVHGDAEALVAGEDAAAPLPVVDDAELATSAIRTLADFAVRMQAHARRSTPGRK